MKKSLLGVILSCWTISQINAQNTLFQEKIDEVTINSLVQYVRDLSGEDSVLIQGQNQLILSRHYLEPGNELAANYIEEKLTEYGYPVERQVFSFNGVNILGVKQGNLAPQKYVVIGAHYDSYPPGTRSPGADDNGSGVAAVLEMAKLLQDVELPFSIIFALWDEEEIGLVGSRAFARSFGANNEELKGYINLDMIAWDGNDDGIVEINTRNIANSALMAEKAVLYNEIYNIGLQTKVVNPGPNSSDFASFWNNGYTAIGINEIYYDEDNNPYWHTLEDKLNKFNFPYFQKTTQLAFVTLMEMAADTNNVVPVKNHIVKQDQILVYPQPFDQEFYLKWLSPAEKVKNVLIHDFQGKSYALEYQPELQKIVLSEYLTSGIYILMIEGEQSIYIQKIIKH